MVPEIGDALVGPGPTSEDCLFLNVWTPAIERNGRRPVMVWLHGGGFRTGSGNSVFYDGQALAQKHGAVVVTVTHRLNALGFLHLAEIGGEKYRAVQQRGDAGHRAWRSSGCGTTSTPSAAIRAT